MDAGHFSATDRYKRFKERAYEHAFVLDSLGLSGAKPAWAKR
jgi:oligopeptidase B